MLESERASVVRAVNVLDIQKGVRHGLEMKDRESVTHRLGKWFVEASVMMKKSQLDFKTRTLRSVNETSRV